MPQATATIYCLHQLRNAGGEPLKRGESVAHLLGPVPNEYTEPYAHSIRRREAELVVYYKSRTGRRYRYIPLSSLIQIGDPNAD